MDEIDQLAKDLQASQLRGGERCELYGLDVIVWKFDPPYWKRKPLKDLTTNREVPFAEGPWDDEYDKMQWVDPVTDLDCMILRNRMGNLCGYVGVPESYPGFGEDAEFVDLRHYVHGGITFTGRCVEEGDTEERICHIPFEGRPDPVWWFGFDCGHAFDLIPLFAFRGVQLGDEYRTMQYVVNECTDLARSL